MFCVCVCKDNNLSDRYSLDIEYSLCTFLIHFLMIYFNAERKCFFNTKINYYKNSTINYYYQCMLTFNFKPRIVYINYKII